MKFIYRDHRFILVDEQKEYVLPDEDISRLLGRPGTRVLRYIDADTVKSIPLKIAIGKIEGFNLFQKHENTPS